ncbi:hypothetical protein NE848_04440 [Gramella jeungdoensis]|uniref:Uncharacterized protein n=1 Tax=Gramella jeungdoensis TaxID=708091 RepID=A0ABT0YZ48_9FLAO|nr:hypothetical protein [Gramella jeungdoensis]MCM8568614.1 hypothetical protein [Gramella jeungdoensis]
MKRPGRNFVLVTGAILLVLPLLFLTGVIFKHYLQTDLWIFTSVYDWIINADQKYGDASFMNWVIRFLLLGGPFIAFLLNFVFIFQRRKTASFSLSYKWINLLIILSGALLCFLFLGYLMMENLAILN